MILSNYSRQRAAGRRHRSARVGAVLLGLTLASASGPAEVQAQSFFVNLVTDPVAGVDRGSTSGFSAFDQVTSFVSFDTFGSEEVGPYVVGLGHFRPGVLVEGDQLDIVGVAAGLSAEDGLELLGGGLGYRLALGDSGLTAFANVNHSDLTLGSEASLAFELEGSLLNGAVGVRHQRAWDGGRLISTAEMIGRGTTGTAFGTTILDEDLRMVRASVLYEQGVPFFFQQRYAAAVTKGLAGLGASDQNSLLASIPGADPDFLRASFSAEASVPLSRDWVVNAGVIGQWTDDSLPVSQRCGFGTNGYARGFDQSYILGDQCIGSRVELAYNLQLPQEGAEVLRFTQAYLGVDTGRLWNNANAFLPAFADGWSSGSIGVRTLQGDVIGEVYLSRIFNEPAGFGTQDDTRLWFRAAMRF